MNLPDFNNVIIPERKIKGYLLSSSHPSGRYKAEFFFKFGFSLENWYLLVDALRKHAKLNEVTRIEKNEFGTRYVIEGPLISPDGRSPDVRVIWFNEDGEHLLRLVTVYPC
jgi:hypothetical protein